VPQPNPLFPPANIFAVTIEAQTETMAWAAATTNPATASLLAGRTNWGYLDNWVVFPSDKNARSRAYGAFARYGSNYPDLFLVKAGPTGTTAWALKIRPLKSGNVRLVFFGLTTANGGVYTYGPAQDNLRPDPLHDIEPFSDEGA
jgi:hypothetical protein